MENETILVRTTGAAGGGLLTKQVFIKFFLEASEPQKACKEDEEEQDGKRHRGV